MSSVLGLKVSPKTPTLAALRVPSASLTRRTSLPGCWRLTCTAAFSSLGSCPLSLASLVRTATSLGRQLPPYPMPAFRKSFPILSSMPMPRATPVTSTPTRPQISAISLIKEIFMARKALLAYLIISAERRSVTRIGQSRGLYNSATASAALWSLAPITTLAGFMKSETACPSLKNSGLATMGSGLSPLCSLSRTNPIMSLVPGGTVLLFTKMGRLPFKWVAAIS